VFKDYALNQNYLIIRSIHVIKDVNKMS